MFYYHLRYYNWILAALGVKKPFLDQVGKPCKINIWNKLWAVILVVFIIIGGAVSQRITGFKKIKNSLKEGCIINELISCSYIIISSLISGENNYVNLYVLTSSILRDLRLSQRSLKLISMKIGFFVALCLGLHAIAFAYRSLENMNTMPIEVQIFYATMFVDRTLIYLAIGHLYIHLSLMLAVIRVVNQLLSENVLVDVLLPRTLIENISSKVQTLKYILWHKVEFNEINHDIGFNLKFLCEVYDDLVACIQLLEKCHGFHMLQVVWIMFSSSVISVTLLVCKELIDPLLATHMCVTMFCCVLLGCYLDDQLRKEVERTETLLVKGLIDFRCDQSRRTTVQIFRQVVNNNRLQFTACSLFRINYAMMVGTVINIITYSIISIQLLINQ